MLSFFNIEVNNKTLPFKPFIHRPYARDEKDALELTNKTFKKEYGYILKVIKESPEKRIELEEEKDLFS